MNKQESLPYSIPQEQSFCMMVWRHALALNYNQVFKTFPKLEKALALENLDGAEYIIWNIISFPSAYTQTNVFQEIY